MHELQAFISWNLASNWHGWPSGWTSIASIVLPRFAANHIQGYSLVTVYFGCAATGVSMGTVAIKRLTGRVDLIVAMPITCL